MDTLNHKVLFISFFIVWSKTYIYKHKIKKGQFSSINLLSFYQDAFFAYEKQLNNLLANKNFCNCATDFSELTYTFFKGILATLEFYLCDELTIILDPQKKIKIVYTFIN